MGKVARISTEDETNTLGLRLFDGSIYEREKNRPGFSQTRFNIYDFKLDLDDLIGPIQQKESGPKEMTVSELLSSIEKNNERVSKPSQSGWSCTSVFLSDLFLYYFAFWESR